MKNEQGRTGQGEVNGRIALARVSVEARLKVLRQSRRGSMFDAPEIAALSSSCALLGVTLLAYFLMLAPARARLEAQQSEVQKSQKRLQNSNATNARGAEATVADVINSVQTFEATHLAQRSEGRTAVIKELNELIRRNGLRTTAVMTFTTLDVLAPNASAGTRATTSNTKQSAFPGTDISFTVEGQYPRLRRLVRDIEASRQFVVINGVELEGVTESSAERTAAERDALVSLRVDLTAYFQRSGAANTGASPVGEAN